MSTAVEAAEQLQAAYDNLCRIFGLLETAEIEKGQMVDGWSPKALMAHIAFWDDYQTARMKAAIQGESAPLGFARPSADNDERALVDNERTWDLILAEADAARQKMVDFARTLDNEHFTAHYPEGERSLSIASLLEHMVRHTRLHSQDLYRYCGSMQRWSRGLPRIPRPTAYHLMDSISGLSEETIVATAVCGEWSIRDVLVHVLSWSEYEYAVLKQWPDTTHESLTPWLDGNGVDDINAALLAERATLNMIDVCDGLTTYHRRILRYFDKCSDEQLADSGDYGWGEEGMLSGFLYGFALHEAEHAEDIWYYRAKR
ncbi:MAG: DinB family protein [Caldilineaceae bacterium]